jgi:hypothetical protein
VTCIRSSKNINRTLHAERKMKKSVPPYMSEATKTEKSKRLFPFELGGVNGSDQKTNTKEIDVFEINQKKKKNPTPVLNFLIMPKKGKHTSD